MVGGKRSFKFDHCMHKVLFPSQLSLDRCMHKGSFSSQLSLDHHIHKYFLHSFVCVRVTIKWVLKQEHLVCYLLSDACIPQFWVTGRLWGPHKMDIKKVIQIQMYHRHADTLCTLLQHSSLLLNTNKKGKKSFLFISTKKKNAIINITLLKKHSCLLLSTKKNNNHNN